MEAQVIFELGAQRRDLHLVTPQRHPSPVTSHGRADEVQVLVASYRQTVTHRHPRSWCTAWRIEADGASYPDCYRLPLDVGQHSVTCWQRNRQMPDVSVLYSGYLRGCVEAVTEQLGELRVEGTCEHLATASYPESDHVLVLMLVVAPRAREVANQSQP
jgi:hypothetical protein